MHIESKLPDIGTTIFTVMSRKAEEHRAINLSQGFPDFAVPAELRDAMARHVEAGHNQYAPLAGVATLREQLARKIARLYARDVDAETEITVVPGATEAIFCAIMACVRPGDEVILFDPSYDSYEPSVRLAGGHAVRIPLAPPAFRIDWQRVADSVSPRTRMIVINSPHNPTGTVLDESDLDALEAILDRTGAVLLSDEVYEHLIYDGLRHCSVLRRPALYARAFAVFSFGKTFHATGWKTGYCVAPPELMREFRRVHQFVTFVAVTPIQHAVADFMAAQPLYVDTLPGFYQSKRDLFLRLIDGSRFRPLQSSGSYFQLLDYSAIADVPDTEMAERLVTRHGVAAIPVSVFYEHPPEMRLLRFCFAKQDQTLERAAELLRAL